MATKPARVYGAVPEDRDWDRSRWENDCFELHGLVAIVYPPIYLTSAGDYELYECSSEQVEKAKVGIERIYARYRKEADDGH